MRTHVGLLAASAVAFLLLSGCRGGSSSGVVPSNTQLQSPRTASFTVFVPASAPGAAIPQSLVVRVLQVNGAPYASNAAPFTMNLTPSTHGCVQAPGGLSCTAAVPAPGGNDTFSLSTYSGINGTGKQVATSQARAMVTATLGTKCTPAPASRTQR